MGKNVAVPFIIVVGLVGVALVGTLLKLSDSRSSAEAQKDRDVAFAKATKEAKASPRRQSTWSYGGPGSTPKVGITRAPTSLPASGATRPALGSTQNDLSKTTKAAMWVQLSDGRYSRDREKGAAAGQTQQHPLGDHG